MKTVYIMRGISGSGKSTVAKKLCHEGFICSTDAYFMVNGEYKFDRSKLGQYHQWNFENFCNFLKQDAATVCVDNTNTTRKEYQRYIDKAKEFGYEVMVVTVGNPWIKQGSETQALDKEYIKKCADRNSHGVPFEVVWQQAMRFELC